jgi:hypothetical protein
MMMLENEAPPIMTDWNDTPVFEGDVIVFVRIKKGLDYTWDPFYETEVINIEGVLYLTIPNADEGGEFLVPTTLVNDMRDGSAAIFCIKGISDNEEAFYKKFYEPKMN